MDDSVKVLYAQLEKTKERMERLESYYKDFRKDFPSPDNDNQKNYDLIILSDIITDYYT